jgi:hypothetical protein
MHVHEIKRRREDERAAAARSAAPSPHALLALQRSAGNQAVAGVIARHIHGAKDVRDDVKWAMRAPGEVPGTKNELILLVLNAIRDKLDPAPAKFTNVNAAVKSLKALKKLDDEDFTLLEAEAGKQFGAQAAPAVTPAEQLKAEVEADRKDMDTTMFDHVLLGATSVDKRPSGYHSTQGGSGTHEAFGARTDGENGTYQRSVRFTADRPNVKPTQSTFFPNTANAEDVKNAITSVYGKRGRELGVQSVRYPETLKGIKMTQREGTAFPLSTPPLPGEGYDEKYSKKKK